MSASRGVAVAFSILALVLAIVAGFVWLVTIKSAQSCTFGGQLSGDVCYPSLNGIHTAALPVALVLLLVAVILFAVAAVARH